MRFPGQVIKAIDTVLFAFHYCWLQFFYLELEVTQKAVYHLFDYSTTLFNSISHLMFPNNPSWKEPVVDSFPRCKTTKASRGDQAHIKEVTVLELTDSLTIDHITFLCMNYTTFSVYVCIFRSKSF